MLKIWGRNTSSNVQKVIWALAEMKLPFERIDVGGAFGKTKEPFYLAMNPNSLVPTLEEEDGFTLWESNSVVRYLAGKHGAGSLEPTDPKVRAKANQWMDWQLSVMGPAITPVFWGLIRTPPEKRDMAAIKKAAEDAGRLFGRLDGWLEGRKYVGGQHFTMGDIPVGCFVYRWYALDIQRPELKNERAWYERLGTRPAYAKHVRSKMT